jgi:hypothetical protein
MGGSATLDVVSSWRCMRPSCTGAFRFP